MKTTMSKKALTFQGDDDDKCRFCKHNFLFLEEHEKVCNKRK